jgi:hypothetical protein
MQQERHSSDPPAATALPQQQKQAVASPLAQAGLGLSHSHMSSLRQAKWAEFQRYQGQAQGEPARPLNRYKNL